MTEKSPGDDHLVAPARDLNASRVRPSTVTLPEKAPPGVVTLLDFFLDRFPRVSAEVWRERFAAEKVWSVEGPVDGSAPYRPLLVLRYRREVERESPVRRDFAVVWSDADLVVVDKPPNLPVTPGGRWVTNTLLHLLEQQTACADLAPLHRLDRLTSGLVVFSRLRSSRSHFTPLFNHGSPVEKVYTAVCEPQIPDLPRRASLTNHIARSPDEYWRQVVVPDGPANARCDIELLDRRAGLALYRVVPLTGRKHQIRVQLAAAGLPILGDPLYGTSPSHDPEDLATRLWLDAHRLEITAFPRPGGSTLSAVWTSSRTPARMLDRAIASQRPTDV